MKEHKDNCEGIYYTYAEQCMIQLLYVSVGGCVGGYTAQKKQIKARQQEVLTGQERVSSVEAELATVQHCLSSTTLQSETTAKEKVHNST